MLFKNVSLYKMKYFKVVRVTGKGGGKYEIGRKRKGPKDSFKDTDCGIVFNQTNISLVMEQINTYLRTKS